MELSEFQPEKVDKEAFIKQYNDAKLETIIEDMGWVSEAQKVLGVLRMDVHNESLQKRAWELIVGIQHDLPLGKTADLQLQNLKSLIQQTGHYKNMNPFAQILDDLMMGYRKILKNRYKEL